MLPFLFHTGAIARQPLACVLGRVHVFGLRRTHYRLAAGVAAGVDIGDLIPSVLAAAPATHCALHPSIHEDSRSNTVSVSTICTI